MIGAEALVRAMIETGVDVVFGIPGGAILPVYDALYDAQDRIKIVLFRHEQGAIHAADSYARVMRRPGVTIVTSGPGATNLFTGLANAYMDSSPVVAVTGQVPLAMFGKDAFQETDMVGSTFTVTKFNIVVRDPNKVRSIFKIAYRIAIHGRPGPVLIDFPRDAQTGKVDREEEFYIPGIFKPIPRPDPSKIAQAAKMLVEAERPVILVGGGVYWSGAWDLVLKVAEMLMAPVVTTLPGKNAVPSTHPLVMGVAGMHGRPEANAALANADVVLALGTRFSDRTICNYSEFRKGRRIIHVDIDPGELGKNIKPDIAIAGDVRECLQMLIKYIPEALKRDEEFVRWLKEIRRKFEDYMSKYGNDVPGLVPWRVLKTLREVLPPDAVVTTGVGAHQMWSEIHWQVIEPGTFVTSAGLGTMGFGLPAAIGAKFARPNRPVLDIDGDGSFLMTCQNLCVVREWNLDIIVTIFNNSALQMVRQWQRVMYSGRIIAVDFHRNPDFVKLAEAFGIEGARPETYADLKIAVERAIRRREPIVIDVTIDKEFEMVKPWVLPGKWLTEIMLPGELSIEMNFGVRA
ncbi:MAG: biosynthetic-type acetolactate synthase large subunit [Crenarchaeota archaeon]|nr:biosynthetic-type acetolactate synthase large subunit [Thermoproteota archaeon]